MTRCDNLQVVTMTGLQTTKNLYNIYLYVVGVFDMAMPQNRLKKWGWTAEGG